MNKILPRLFFVLLPAITTSFVFYALLGSFVGLIVFVLVCGMGIYATEPEIKENSNDRSR